MNEGLGELKCRRHFQTVDKERCRSQTPTPLFYLEAYLLKSMWRILERQPSVFLPGEDPRQLL